MLFSGSLVNPSVFWLVAMLALLIVEAIVPGLISIWFALGALAALIGALLGAPLWLQVVLFFVASVALLVLTRPLAKKYVNSRVTPTNADRMLGRECVVTETIDNLRGTGAVSVDGKVWTARLEQDGPPVEKGEVLFVRKIEGVKLLVSK